MSDIKTIKKGQYTIRSDVYQAIQQASTKYGVPFIYMLALAAKESSFDPNAKATTSSATGLYQFVKATWADMWKDYKIPLPSPTDPAANADAGARFVKQIQKSLNTYDPAALYLGHFLGTGGANALMTAYRNNPNTLADTVISAGQLQANKSVFYRDDGSSKTVKEIYDWSNGSIGGIIAKLNAV